MSPSPYLGSQGLGRRIVKSVKTVQDEVSL